MNQQFNKINHSSATPGALTSGLKASLDRLLEPDSYYSGVQGLFHNPPDNILVFHRSSRERVAKVGVQLHSRFVLSFFLETPAEMTIEGQTLSMHEGTGVLLFPYQQHVFSNIQNDRINWVFVSFELTDFEALVPLRNRPFLIAPSVLDDLKSVVDGYVDYQNGSGLAACKVRPRTCLLLNDILIQAERSISTPAGMITGADARVRECARQIYAHLDQPLRIDELSRNLHISSSHLCRLFRANMGITLGRFMAEARMNHAAALLRTTKQSISAVAEACGFESLYSFSRSFKNHAGVSPSAYRARGHQR